MKQLLLTIAALVLVGCGESQSPEPPTAKAPDRSIHNAAYAGQIEVIKQHLATGTDVNAKTDDGRTPLHVAAFWDSQASVLLIEKGADVNAKADDGRTPLHRAALGGNKETVELLIAKGADVNAMDDTRRSPLDSAQKVEYWHKDEINITKKEIAELLRKHGGKTGEELNGGEPVAEASQPEPPTAKATEISIQGTSNPEADQALNDAVWEDNIKSIKQALNDGAKVDTKDIVGDTPLHLAAYNGRKEIAELLIAKGADVNAKDDNGGTSLNTAAGSGYREIVEMLIANSADVNAKDEDGYTPLHRTSLGGHKEIAEILIAKGADVNAKNEDGWTPLHYAAGSGHKEIVELFIANGADVNAKSDVGKTPLDWAVIKKKTEAANLLRKHGGKTAEELNGGEPVAEASQPEPPTAKASDISIHDAAYDGNIAAVKQHLAAGANVNVKMASGLHQGYTPLHSAASKGQKEIVELLIAKGADVNAKEVIEWTPLHYAVTWKHKEIVELLIANGADVNAKNMHDEPPLDYTDVDDVDSKEIADLLRKHGGKTSEELKASGN